MNLSLVSVLTHTAVCARWSFDAICSSKSGDSIHKLRRAPSFSFARWLTRPLTPTLWPISCNHRHSRIISGTRSVRPRVSHIDLAYGLLIWFLCIWSRENCRVSCFTRSAYLRFRTTSLSSYTECPGESKLLLPKIAHICKRSYRIANWLFCLLFLLCNGIRSFFLTLVTLKQTESSLTTRRHGVQSCLIYSNSNRKALFAVLAHELEENF